MVRGLDIFRKYFEKYADNYVIIGGTACDIIIDEAKFEPRATDDIDLILIIEALSTEFVKKFWEFIKDGKYQIQQIESEKRNCYRFEKPLIPDFPKQIELFCRIPDAIAYYDLSHLTPVPTDEGLSNLSAILLNDIYYKYTIDNSFYLNGIHLAQHQALICLKAYAYLSNKALNESGKDIKKWNIVKHKYDVFRLVFLLKSNDNFDIPLPIKVDLQQFADAIKNDLPNPEIFKNNGYGSHDMKIIFEQFVKSFNLNK